MLLIINYYNEFPLISMNFYKFLCGKGWTLNHLRRLCKVLVQAENYGVVFFKLHQV